MSVIAEANGRWRSILPALGIPEEFLSGKHQPCPLCGGKDRARFTDHEQKGRWFCNQCGNGDGMQLVMEYNGWDFKTAAREIEKLIPQAVEFKPAPKKDPLPRLKAMAGRATDAGYEVKSYLKSRGLTEHPALKQSHEFHAEAKRNFPCMLGLVVDVNGEPVTYHVTYLEGGKKAEVKPNRKVMPPIKKITGCAIRFGEGEHIAIAEGIETALAVQERSGLPTWATISAHGMESLELPEQVKSVSVYADNDKSFTGQAAAYAFAKKHHKLNIEVIVPIHPDTDFCDER